MLSITFLLNMLVQWRESRDLRMQVVGVQFRGRQLFFPQALLGGFSFRAGEHTTSAVREIAGPTQNEYNFAEKPNSKACPKNLIEKCARSIFDDVTHF